MQIGHRFYLASPPKQRWFFGKYNTHEINIFKFIILEILPQTPHNTNGRIYHTTKNHVSLPRRSDKFLFPLQLLAHPLTPIPRNVGLTLLVVVWFCWGFSYPATKLMLGSFDLWTSRSLIMVIVGATLLTIGRVLGKTIAVPRSQWRDLTIAAFLNMTVFQIGMTLGVHYLSAGRTAVIVYTMPLWIMLAAWPILGEQPTRLRLCALVLGLLGLYVLMDQDFGHLLDAGFGACATLVSAIAFGLGTVWVKRCVWDNDPTVLAGWQVVLGSVPVIVLWSFLGESTDWTTITFESWSGFLFNLIFANVLAYCAWFRVIGAFPATVTGLGTLAIPIIGVLASAAVLGEHVGWRELTALTLIVSALALNLRPNHSG